MGIPQFSTAFCGQSLRTASLIIAWFGTILVGIIWSLYLSVLPALYGSEFSPYHQPDHFLQGIYSIVGMILTYFFIEHCLLLRGVLKKKHYFLLPWIVITCVSIGVCIGTTVVSFIMIFAVSPFAYLVFIPTSLLNGILVYCLLVINSYYLEIKKENSRIENTATA